MSSSETQTCHCKLLFPGNYSIIDENEENTHFVFFTPPPPTDIYENNVENTVLIIQDNTKKSLAIFIAPEINDESMRQAIMELTQLVRQVFPNVTNPQEQLHFYIHNCWLQIHATSLAAHGGQTLPIVDHLYHSAKIAYNIIYNILSHENSFLEPQTWQQLNPSQFAVTILQPNSTHFTLEPKTLLINRMEGDINVNKTNSITSSPTSSTGVNINVQFGEFAWLCLGGLFRTHHLNYEKYAPYVSTDPRQRHLNLSLEQYVVAIRDTDNYVEDNQLWTLVQPKTPLDFDKLQRMCTRRVRLEIRHRAHTMITDVCRQKNAQVSSDAIALATDLCTTAILSSKAILQIEKPSHQIVSIPDMAWERCVTTLSPMIRNSIYRLGGVRDFVWNLFWRISCSTHDISCEGEKHHDDVTPLSVADLRSTLQSASLSDEEQQAQRRSGPVSIDGSGVGVGSPST